jgi:MFS family permease
MRADSEHPAVPPPVAASGNGDAAAARAAPGAPAEGAGRVLNRRYVTAALMLVMVLVSMEMTITSTVMPTIIGELHGLEHYSWVASVYLLTSTVTMPLYGRLADALGRKRVLIAALMLFLAGSLLCAWARSMTELIIFRGVQGLGAGGVMPVVLTILGDIFTLKERARIQGLFSAVWGTSALAGPVLGAFLEHSLGWRSIFYCNIPLGLPGLAVLLWKYKDHGEPHSTDLDLPGVATLAVACTAVLTLFSRLGPGGWSWPWVLGLLTATAAALAYFIAHEARAASPIMPPGLLTRRDIGPSVLGSFLLGAIFLSLDTYVPLYAQGGRGGGTGGSALAVGAVMLTWALSSVAAAPLMVRWGFRRTAMLGSVLIVMGCSGLLACSYAGASRWALAGTLALTGLGFGPASMSYLLAAQGAVGWQQRGIVTSGVAFFRTIGGAMGIGLLGGLFNLLIRGDLTRFEALGVKPADLLDPRRGHGPTPSAVPAELVAPVQHMIAAGLVWVFAGMLLLALAQALVTLLMSPRPCDHAVSRTEAFEAAVG